MGLNPWTDTTKMDEEKAAELRKLNKKILEIKKKIQLSGKTLFAVKNVLFISSHLEGQRRALFEDCESERKSNVDEILQLKKEIASLVVVLHESKSLVAKYRLQTKWVFYFRQNWAEKYILMLPSSDH